MHISEIDEDWKKAYADFLAAAEAMPSPLDIIDKLTNLSLEQRTNLKKAIRTKVAQDIAFGIVHGWDKDPNTYDTKQSQLTPYYKELFDREIK